jgi:hypothetical protein
MRGIRFGVQVAEVRLFQTVLFVSIVSWVEKICFGNERFINEPKIPSFCMDKRQVSNQSSCCDPERISVDKGVHGCEKDELLLDFLFL